MTSENVDDADDDGAGPLTSSSTFDLPEVRELLREHHERITELELLRVKSISQAIEMLELLKDRSPGWVSGPELRRAFGNGYRLARAALLRLRVIEQRSVSTKGHPRIEVRAASVRATDPRPTDIERVL